MSREYTHHIPSDIASTLADHSQDRSRSRRRPALIPASAFNALDSTHDLSSILPSLHGLQDGNSIYILPPAPPPPELALRLKLEEQQQKTLRRDPDVDAEGDWSMSGSTTPLGVNSNMKRWSLKDLVDGETRDIEEGSGFETPKQYIHKRQTSGVSDDLFSWVNSSTDGEIRHVEIDHRVVRDLDSLPTSPMSGTARPDVQRQLERLQQASRRLNDL